MKVIELDSSDNRSFNIWRTFIEGVTPGMGYAYRVDGPREPCHGHRFDPEKVLIDPYSKGNSLALWDRGAACVPGDNLTKVCGALLLIPIILIGKAISRSSGQ